jgi:hypothetical protein
LANPVTPGGQPRASSVLNATARTQANTAHAARRSEVKEMPAKKKAAKKGAKKKK